MVSQWVFCVIQYLYYRRMLGRHLLFTICPLPPCVSIASKRQKKVADESSVWLGLGGSKGFCRKNAEQSEKTEAVDGRWLCVCVCPTRGECARLPVLCHILHCTMYIVYQPMHKLQPGVNVHDCLYNKSNCYSNVKPCTNSDVQCTHHAQSWKSNWLLLSQTRNGKMEALFQKHLA